MDALVGDNMQNRDENFVIVKRWMLTELSLNAEQAYVFAAIHNMPNGWNFKTQDFMSYLGLGSSLEEFNKFTAVLQVLKDRGFIEINQNHSGTYNFKSCYKRAATATELNWCTWNSIETVEPNLSNE